MLLAAVAMTFTATAAEAEFAFVPKEAMAEMSEVAEKLGVEPGLFLESSCTNKERVACGFLADTLVGVAGGEIGARADTVILAFSYESSDAKKTAIMWGVLMALINPEMPADERGKLALPMMQALFKRDFEDIVEIRGSVEYTLRSRAEGVVWLIARSIKT